MRNLPTDDKNSVMLQYVITFYKNNNKFKNKGSFTIEKQFSIAVLTLMCLLGSEPKILPKQKHNGNH